MRQRLHNIRGLHGHSEFFRLAFGLGSLIRVWFSHHQCFRGIGAPVVLMPWFLVITVVAGVDVYSEYFPIQGHIDAGLHALSELVEMLIGISGFLFVWLNAGMLSRHSRRDLPWGARPGPSPPCVSASQTRTPGRTLSAGERKLNFRPPSALILTVDLYGIIGG
jgi:hypothetical protein